MIIKKIISTLSLVTFFCLTPTPIYTADIHWAGTEINQLRDCLDLDNESLDNPATLALQERLFALAGLNIQPAEGIKRYSIISAMVSNLQLPEISEEETETIISDYIDKCDY